MGKRIFLPPHSMSRNVTNSGGIINGRVGVHHCIVNTLTIFWSIGTNWENWLTMLVCQKAMVASLRAWEEMLVHNLILLIHVQVKLQFWICPPVCWTFRIQCDRLENGFASYCILANVSIRVPVVCRRGV